MIIPLTKHDNFQLFEETQWLYRDCDTRNWWNASEQNSSWSRNSHEVTICKTPMEGDAIKELIGNADLNTTVCEKVRKCSLVDKHLTTNFTRINLTQLSNMTVRSCFMYTS